MDLVADFLDGSIFDSEIDEELAERAREHVMPWVTHYVEHMHNKAEYSGHDLWHDAIKGDLHAHLDEVDPIKWH